MPSELLERLSEDESSNAAVEAPAVRILTDLRMRWRTEAWHTWTNEGGGPAAMLAFGGAVMKGNRITAFSVLRVGEREYRVLVGMGVVASSVGRQRSFE